MASSKWAGRTVTNARKPWLPKVAAGDVSCWRCGLPITPGQPWHMGHVVDRALGGSHAPTNLLPEHVRCSTSAGGRLASTLRKQAKRGRTIYVVPERRTWLNNANNAPEE